MRCQWHIWQGECRQECRALVGSLPSPQAASDGSKQDGDAGGADWAPLLP